MRIVFIASYPICHLSQYIPFRKTEIQHAASWIVNLAESLKNEIGIELHIVTEYPYIASDLDIEIKGIKYHILKSLSSFNLSTLYYFSKRRIAQKVRSLEPDIVHAHGTEGSTGLSAIKTKLPYLLSIQGIMAACAKKEMESSYAIPARMILMSFIEKYVIKNSTYFGIRTNFDRNFVKGVNKNAILYYAPEAINSCYFDIKPNYDSFNLLYIGSLIERKDPITLIKAVRLLKVTFPQVKLHLVGKGPSNFVKKLLSMITKLNLEKNVFLKGYFFPEQIQDEFRNSCILVLPSLIENSPNVILEAMAAGLAVIATDVGGVGSLIKDGANGILIKPGDELNLARRIETLFCNREMLKQLGHNGNKYTLRFNWPPTVSQTYLAIYKSIIESQRH